MTDLSRRVTRRTVRDLGPGSRRLIVVSLGPGDVISMRLAGTRTHYTARVSSVFTQLALWYADAERDRRRAARQARKEAR